MSVTQLQTLATTPGGSLTSCACCDDLHLTFGLLRWRFSAAAFERFCQFIATLDAPFSEGDHAGSAPARGVQVALPPTNMSLALTLAELAELRTLLISGQAALARHAADDAAQLCDQIEAWLNAG